MKFEQQQGQQYFSLFYKMRTIFRSSRIHVWGKMPWSPSWPCWEWKEKVQHVPAKPFQCWVGQGCNGIIPKRFNPHMPILHLRNWTAISASSSRRWWNKTAEDEGPVDPFKRMDLMQNQKGGTPPLMKKVEARRDEHW
jgi:hypothetical protein